MFFLVVLWVWWIYDDFGEFWLVFCVILVGWWILGCDDGLVFFWSCVMVANFCRNWCFGLGHSDCGDDEWGFGSKEREFLVLERDTIKWFFFIGLINLGSIFNLKKLTKHLFNFEKHDKTFFFSLKNKLLKTEGKNGYQTCSNFFFFVFVFIQILPWYFFFNVNQNYLLLF